MTTWTDPIPDRVMSTLRRIAAIEPKGDTTELGVREWAQALGQAQRIASELAEELACQIGDPEPKITDRHGRSRPLRVDTFRRQIHGTIEMLRLVEQQLDDLYLLAYDRPRAAEAQRVAGGTRDYALDTHGSTEARHLWRRAASTILDTTEDLVEVCHQVTTWLRTGDRPTERRDRSADIDLTELAAALDAQQRRAGRDEYTPTPTEAQPAADRVPDAAAELAHLQAAVRRTVEESELAEPKLVNKIKNPRGGRIRPARWRLTPAQYEAWNRAIRPLNKEAAKRHD